MVCKLWQISAGSMVEATAACYTIAVSPAKQERRKQNLYQKTKLG